MQQAEPIDIDKEDELQEPIVDSGEEDEEDKLEEDVPESSEEPFQAAHRRLTRSSARRSSSGVTHARNSPRKITQGRRSSAVAGSSASLAQHYASSSTANYQSMRDTPVSNEANLPKRFSESTPTPSERSSQEPSSDEDTDGRGKKQVTTAASKKRAVLSSDEEGSSTKRARA